jgi:lysyl-tRNA synthetase class 1
MTSDIQHLGFEVAAWPFQEARQLLQRRLRGTVPEKGYVLFETGYGASGPPHIGTFAEVVRTTMVRQAFERLAPEIPTRLFCFSEDMDGLRKVPDNVPNKDLLAAHLGKPLTGVPDPFGTHASFGYHNNACLRQFLDTFGFAYEFKSATECYRAGLFDQALLAVLRHYDAILEVVLPTLGPERRATYSPFLPVSPKTGKILQVPVLAHDAKAGTIVFKDEDGTHVETVVTGGHCKLQWKCDWAMRWVALTAEDIQTQVYEVGKRHQCFGALREWFTALYQILLGQDSGPRLGSFIALYGISETVALLDRAIAGEELSEARHCARA